MKTERLENNLRHCGENWLTNSKFSSLMEMAKVHSSSQRLMLAPKSSALKIEETGLEKLVFKLASLGSGHTFTPVTPELSVLGVSPEKCCNVLSLKPTGLMCDDRSLASPLFRRLVGRGALFCSFLSRWVLHHVFYLIRGVALHESPSCSREDSLD